MRTPGDKKAYAAGAAAFKKKYATNANPHKDKRTRLHKSWLDGWMTARDKFMGHSDPAMIAHRRKHRVSPKVTTVLLTRGKIKLHEWAKDTGQDALAKRVASALEAQNAATNKTLYGPKTSRVHGERGYMIFNKDTNRILCHIGVFERLSGAAVDRRNRQKTTKSKLGICRVTVTVSGRTW